MTNEQIGTHLTQTISDRFIGRVVALSIFHALRAPGGRYNGVYYYGQGGSGKTWILHKIKMEVAGLAGIQVPPIIDFYDTKNDHVHGLQESIKTRLDCPEAFQQFVEAQRKMQEELAKGSAANDSVVAHWERIANQAFIRGCIQAAQKKTTILRFDTFERIQNHYVGSWLLKSFLPQVRELLIVFAGRPAPNPADMPDNISSYQLMGLTEDEATLYIGKVLPGTSDAAVQTMRQRTQGVPLLIELIMDLPSPQREQFIDELDRLEEGRVLQQTPELQRALVGQFAHPINNRNRIIWAMAFLWRRFDLPMLEYIVKNGTWFHALDYQPILDELKRSVYIKEYPEEQSHLLHDEIQRMVSRFVLEEAADPMGEMRDLLYDLVVNHYYIEAIQKANADLAPQLRAEQLGYILDRAPADGLARYNAYISQFGKERDNDFEELLWGEVRDHLNNFQDGYMLCVERGRRLHGYSLWEPAQEHYEEMLQRYIGKDEQIQTSLSLGFMLFRQGKLDEARKKYEGCLAMAGGPEDLDERSQIYNNLGQLERSSGRWEEALRQFNLGFSSAQRARSNERMIDTYINRGYLYSLKGQYREAMTQCDSAIDLLETMPKDYFKQQRSIYARRNRGIVYRHSEDFTRALDQLEQSLAIAVEMDNETAICDVAEQLGITHHLLGRSFRRMEHLPPGRVKESLQEQLEAWKYLSLALNIARRTNSLSPIADGLNRLAKLYREVEQLNIRLANYKFLDEVCDTFENLKQELLTFDNTFEIEFQDHLVIQKSFDQLNWLGKSERLFEVSALIADQLHDHYRMLDSLTETARMLMWLERPKEAKVIIARLEDLCRREGQPEVFAIITETTIAHLEFINEEYSAALPRFIDTFGKLAITTGYASYMLTDRLRDLEWRLRDLKEMNPQLASDWCDALETGWEACGAMERRPDMRHMLERIRMLIDAKMNPA